MPAVVRATVGRGVSQILPRPRPPVTRLRRTLQVMPLYEFVCDACGERFEGLVDVGTEGVDCRICGEPGARRVLSAQAAPMHLVKPTGERRKQERANAKLRRETKTRFKEARARARKRSPGPGT